MPPGRRGPPPFRTRSCRERLARYAQFPFKGTAASRSDHDDARTRLPEDPAMLERLDPQSCPQRAAEVRPALAPVAARGRKLPALLMDLVEREAEGSKHPLTRRPEGHRPAIARGGMKDGPPSDEGVEDR